MRKVLIPVDAGNPARSRAAVAEAISIYSKEPVTVHLLSVQPAVSGHVAMFFGSGELQQLQCGAGAEDFASAQAQLAAAGVPFESTGSWVATASSWAKIGRAVSPPGCSDRSPNRSGKSSAAAATARSSAPERSRECQAGSSPA